MNNNPINFFKPKQLLRVAAVLFVITCVAIGLWYFQLKETIVTKFGETRTITMPDETIIVLNRNSRLSFYTAWGAYRREVWIDGEALFRVRHLNRDSFHVKPFDLFYVHCNAIKIEVLGTTFNVKNRHGNVGIGLIRGKIKVDYAARLLSKSKNQMMEPGDFVQFADNQFISKKTNIKPKSITSWMYKRLIFSNPYLYQIIENLQDEYGYKISLGDAALNNLQIPGEINAASVKELLQLISTKLPLNFNQIGKKISLTKAEATVD